jgi:hypothetical protein
MESKNLPIINFIGQASTSETYTYLMDALKSDYVVKHRYERSIICGNCQRRGELKKEECRHFELFDENIININTPEQFAGRLLKNYILVPDYTCEYCHRKSNNTRQEEHLVMVPDILVMLFNKYTGDSKTQTIYCPEVFELPGIDGSMKFEQVAQARHAGSLNGGHYYAVVKRNGLWYIANDMQISQTTFSQSPNTYMVFYCRVENGNDIKFAGRKV